MNYLDIRLKDIENGYIQHAGVPGMKWGWTKDGKRTGAKEAMTEQERAQRRKELLAKIGKGLGIAAGVAGAALAIKNRKKIGNFIKTKYNRFKDDRMYNKVNKQIKKDFLKRKKYEETTLKNINKALDKNFSIFKKSGRKAHWDNITNKALEEARQKTKIKPWLKRYIA